MMKIVKSRFMFIVPVIAIIIIGFSVFLPALSYQTDISETIINNFTIALDSTSSVLEDYPTPDPEIDGSNASYTKAVQIVNTGYIDCYVRVRLDFSEEDIQNKTKFSSDGVNYYSVSDYRNHLPSGWIYNSTDGYYYYTPMVKAENWEDYENQFRYDESIGEYFYKNRNIVSASCMTTPLIRYVRTEFAEPKDMRSYDLNVYSESVPFYFGNDYASCWANYLAD